MVRKRSGIFITAFTILELTGCAAVGMHPVLPGPNPVIDRIFSYLQLFFPFLIIILLFSMIGLGTYLLLMKSSFFDRITGKNYQEMSICR